MNRRDANPGYVIANVSSSCIVAICAILFCVSCAKTRPNAVNQSRQTTSSPIAANVKSSAEVVKIGAGNTVVVAGTSTDASLRLAVSSGYHINANPATFPYLIATELTPEKIDGVAAGKPIYPTSEKKTFQFADVPLAVYEGDVQIMLPLRAATNAAKGTRSLPLTVRVQACDNEKCYPPAILSSYISVEVK
jgi:thioredoxin:protein disulfide reductase